MKDTRQLRATFLLLLTAVIWGLAFVAQEVGAEYLGTFSFNGIRFLMGAASLIPVIALFERESVDAVKIRRLLGGSLLAGTVLFTASALQQYGVQLGTPAGKAGFITGLYTVIVPLLSLLLFRRKTHALVWVGAVLAVAGLLMLNLDENFNLKIGAGECCLLAGSVMWAVHILVIDKFVTTLSPLKFSAVGEHNAPRRAIGSPAAILRGNNVRRRGLHLSGSRTEGFRPDCCCYSFLHGIGFQRDRRRDYPARAYGVAGIRGLRTDTGWNYNLSAFAQGSPDRREKLSDYLVTLRLHRVFENVG